MPRVVATLLICLAPGIAWAQTRAEAVVWGPSGRYGQMTSLSGTWSALDAIDIALNAPATGSTVYVSGGGDALRLAVAAAGSTGTLIEIIDSATYDWVLFSNKSRIYVRARTGQSPKIQSDPTAPSASGGGNSNAIIFEGDNTDIGLQGLTFLVREYGNAETVPAPWKVGAIRYNSTTNGTRLQGLLIQDARFEPLDRTKGAVIAINLSNDAGTTANHRDIGIRRSVFDSTGTVEASTEDLAAISVADFENVLVSNVHFRRTSTQPTPSEMRGIRANVINGLVEYAYCEDIAGAGGQNECVMVSSNTGTGLGSLDGLSVVVKNSAALSANRAFAVNKTNSTMTVQHAVVVTSQADQILRVGAAAPTTLTVRDSIFLQLSGTAQLLTNSSGGAFVKDHNLYRWLGSRPFTPDATDKYPGSANCDVNCDPLFVNPLGSDFRMAAGSAALASASDGSDMGVLFYSISPLTRSLGVTGGTGAVAVTASGWWTGSANVSWITPQTVSNTLGSGNVNYLVGANTSSQSRTGVLTLAGIPFTITQAGISCSPSLSPTSTTVTAYGASGSVTVSQAASDCSYTATSNAAWISITGGATGTGISNPVAYTVASNASSQARTGTMTIAGLTFTVTQYGLSCGYTLTPSSFTLPPGATTGSSIALTALVSDCAWSTTSNASWITVTGGSSGIGNGNISFNVSANPNSASRSSSLNIGGQTVTVTQQGVTCSQQLSATSAFVNAPAGPGTAVTVTSSAPDCSWGTTVSDPWISITGPNVQSGTASVAWSVQANTGSQLRSGTMTIAGQAFTVNQAGTACSFSLSSTSTPAPLDSAGSNGSVGVTSAAVDCGWTATSNAPWITVTGGSSGVGSSAVTYNVAPNSSSFARAGTITIAGITYTVNQAGLACGYYLTPTTATASAAGMSGTVALSAGVNDCTWSATSNVNWLTVTSANPAVGASTVTYTVSANASSLSRNGTITIAGQQFTVNQPGVTCSYTLSSTSTQHGSSAVNSSINITASAEDCAWTMSSNASWLTLVGPTSRTGSGAVSYAVTANSLSVNRTGTLTVAGTPVTVRQDGVACTYTLAATESAAASAGGPKSVKVTAAATDCAWTNQSNASWLSVTSGANRTGTGDVAFTVASNSTSSKNRVGTITIAGQTYTVTQGGVACTYTVPKTATASAAGGKVSLQITTSPADCDWSSTSAATWLTYGPTNLPDTSGTGTATVDVNVAPTTSSKARTGSVSLATGTVAITQSGVTCAYTLSATTANFTYQAANGSVFLDANANDCAWTAVKGPVTWLGFPTAQGTGDALIPYTVAANATTLPRQAIVQIGGVDHTVSQGPAPCTVVLPSKSGTAASAVTSGSFSVTAASAECTWTAESSAAWLKVTAPTSGGQQGSGSVKYTAEANSTSKTRTATIKVNDQYYTLSQTGMPCTYTLDPTSTTLVPLGGAYTVNVKTSVSDCTWTSTSNADWISITSGASGAGEGKVVLYATGNTGTKSRTGSISVGGKAFTVNQTAQGGTSSPYTRYLAEGATSAFFSTRIALLNPGTAATTVNLRFQKTTGQVVDYSTTVKAQSRATIDPRQILGNAEFSTEVSSASQVIVDRTLTWDASGYGSHSETAVQFPSQTWYLAEGSTNGMFDLFYLIQNPNPDVAKVQVKFLLPGGTPPVVKTYDVPANTRYNIWVDMIPGLDKADLSGVITSDRPIMVERALYMSRNGVFFLGGHESAGVTAPDTDWFLAEGATGPYFDTYVLVANPNDTEARVSALYMLPDGTTIEKFYTVDPQSRFSVWVDQEDPRLADTSVATIVRSLNGVPIIVERAMWWPGNWTTWTEAHNSPGATETGIKWAVAEGEVGGTTNAQTYLLIANTGGTAGKAKVTLMFESGTTASTTVDLAPYSRSSVDVRAVFKESVGKRFGAVIESIGTTPVPIVVERAMYGDSGGVSWAAGTNALATKLQ